MKIDAALPVKPDPRVHFPSIVLLGTPAPLPRPKEPLMAQSAPSGVITLVFTDIQGSTALWEKMGDAFRPVLDRHNDLIRELIDQWDGYEVKAQGDSFMIAFDRGTNAVQCCMEVQRTLAEEPWPEEVGELLVRIGMHTGEPFLGYDPSGRPDYFGPMVNRAARVSAAGHGGQTLISSSTRDVIEGVLSSDLQLLDLGTHRLRGLEEPEHLYQVIHPDLQEREFPRLKTLDEVRTNLKTSLSAFVGREQELAELRRLVNKPETRLVTLLGFGGMGKTRTALQLAEHCIHDFADGVWWVEAEEARDLNGLIERTAYALNVHLQPQPSVKEQLWNYLRDRELLLFLDNAEQIKDAARGVNELLGVASKVRCVVTSRRALELQLERVVEIRPLPPAEAEALFMERARIRQDDFTMTPENAGDIKELCRRLEGVPLAIELAAVRIVGMTPREMLQRLDARFRLLQTRAPELPDRQRALRGTMDYSYDMLGEEERALFGQVSVFAGGFSMDDAEEVCDVFDVFEGVMELRRDSLLRTETDPATQQTRYLMLESLRDYAAEKLQESAGAGDVSRRHAEYFLKFGEKRAARMRTRDELKVLDELGVALDNLRAALDWARENEEGEMCARLSLVLYQVLYRRGFWQEARECLELGIEALTASGEPKPALEAAVEQYLAVIALDTGDQRAARDSAEASLKLRRELNDAPGTAEALNLLGLLAMDAGDLDQAQTLLDEALGLLGHRDHWRRGVILHNLARLASRRGDAETSGRLYEDALRHRRGAGDARGEAETLGNLGVIAHIAGDFEQARRMYLEGLTLHRRLRERHGTAIMLNNLAELAELDADKTNAIVLYVQAERLFRELQSAHVAFPAESLQRIAAELGDAQWNEVRAAADRRSWEELV